jgi:EAL domain-containing protein (putative c-di-GMP-specific phosphodiesterase class I)
MSESQRLAGSLHENPLPASLRRGLTSLFQPILRLGACAAKPTLFALECLTRGPRGTGWEDADLLFHWVRTTGRDVEMDQACVRAGLAEAARLPGSPAVCLNVHLATLAHPAFIAGVVGDTEALGLAPSRLLFDIVESPPALDAAGVRRNLQRLRDQGVRIAMDDFGLGHSNLHRLLAVRPDFIKLHSYFVAGCHQDPHRLIVLESLANLAARLGCQVMVKGIERPEESQAIRSLGIELAQGFLWSEPVTAGRLRESAMELSPGAAWTSRTGR